MPIVYKCLHGFGASSATVILLIALTDARRREFINFICGNYYDFYLRQQKICRKNRRPHRPRRRTHCRRIR
jgi:hypothetical protein